MDTITVEILLPERKSKYLGQMISFLHQEIVKIQHRIRCVLSLFAKHRQELTSRSYLLRHRLRLFDSVVTPTMMCGSGTWTTTQEHEKMTRTTERKMLRLIFQTKRKYKIRGKRDIDGIDVKNDERSETETDSES